MTALYHVQVLEWNRRRDFFPAQVVATTLNAGRTKVTDPTYSADDILESEYPKRPVMITHDPDHGAAGDWKSLKAALKGHTKAEVARRAKLKPHHAG